MIAVGNHCDIEVLHDIPCIKISWKAHPPSNEFRQACEKVLELMDEFRIDKLLTDNSEAKLFNVEDQEWLNAEWLPRAEKLGYRGSAVIMPRDPFVKFAVNSIAFKRDRKFFIRIFSNEKEALNWLKSI